MTYTICQNCGNTNEAGNIFCRFCGTRFASVPANADPTQHRPYAWKTDEYQTQSEPRPSGLVGRTSAIEPERTGAFIGPHDNGAAANPVRPGTWAAQASYRCPYCGSHFLPRIERKISTAGWITFALLLVFFFPLFWIGLLIKENLAICPSCLRQVR